MRSGWILAGATALVALTSGPAVAQGRGHGHDRGMPPGQAKKEERQEARFADRDRELAHNWYLHERREPDEVRDLPPGLRDRDRLPPGIERRLQRGWIVDRDYRRILYPAPVTLVRVFPPPPPGYRFVVLGGHVLLVDAGYRVFDVIHLEVNLGL